MSKVVERRGMSYAQAERELDLIQITEHQHVSVQALKAMLPDVPTALFFAKAYNLDYQRLGQLLARVFNTAVIDALVNQGEAHSNELQDYLIDTVPPAILEESGIGYSDAVDVPDSEVLKHLFESAAIEVAQSIQKVADKVASVLDRMPSKFGKMTFGHLMELNRQRGSIGTYRAQIEHRATPPRLVILDVSGSMSEPTVRAIADEVVGLAYAVNASMAIVSTNTFFWEAGTFTTEDILDAAEYGGTHYETLAPLFDRDWATVITIADYDSAAAALEYLERNSTGTIGELMDISLVGRPTYLAQCLSRFSQKVTPLLIGSGYSLLR